MKISGNLLYGVPFQFSKEDVDATLSVSQFSNLEQPNVRINLLDLEGNVVGTLWADKAEKEVSAKCSKIRFDWSKGGKFIVSDLMLNFGNTALPYEPYTDGVPKLYGNKINLEVHGKNLFDLEYATDINNWKPGGYRYIPYYVGKGNKVSVSYSEKLPLGREFYAVIGLSKGGIQSIYCWLYHSGADIGKTQFTFTAEEDYIYLNVSGNNIVQSIKELKNFQIEVSSAPTTYEPYHEPQSLSISTPTGLPAIPVDSDGNYTDANGQQWIADYVDLKLGKLYKKVMRLNLKDVDAINIAHGFHSNGNGYLSFSVKNVSKEHRPISNRYKGSMWTQESGYTYVPNSNTIVFVDDRFTDKQTAIKLVQDTYIIYALTSQIETDLTPEEIQAYKNLATYAGTTIVENDAECYMEVSAGGGDALRAKKLALILGE